MFGFLPIFVLVVIAIFAVDLVIAWIVGTAINTANKPWGHR